MPSHSWYRISRALLSMLAVVALLAIASRANTADWPMRGRDQTRNPVVPDDNGPRDFQFHIDSDSGPTKNIRWSAQLGHLSSGDPVIAGGMVWVGTNNEHPRDKKQTGDASVLMCFRESDGEFLYQYVSPRLESHHLDWSATSLASSPLIERDRLWFCTNRCEVICLDIAPLRMQTGEPCIVWKVDMRSQFGVIPRGVMIGDHSSHCSIASYRDLIYVNTTHTGSHGQLPVLETPSLICFEKQTGKLRWKDNSPGKNILNAQHGSPLVIEVKGRAQAIMGQADGWVRGFEALSREVLWKFDINRKSAKPELFSGDRSDLVTTPVFHDGRVYFAVGRHWEACSGQGRLCCVDPTKRGDISSELDDGTGVGRPNPNSGLVWEYLGGDNGAKPRMNRTLSTPAIHKGLAIAPDLSGIVHCVDARSGARVWTYDTLDQIAGSPLIVGDTAYVGTDNGEIFLLEVFRERKLMAKREVIGSIEAGMVHANGVLYLTTRRELHAIRDQFWFGATLERCLCSTVNPSSDGLLSSAH